jgi:hypothetical protein
VEARAAIAQLLSSEVGARTDLVRASTDLTTALLAARPPADPAGRAALVAAGNLAMDRLASDDVALRRWARGAIEVAAQCAPPEDQLVLLQRLIALIASPKATVRTGASAAVVDWAPHVVPTNQGALVDALIELLTAEEEIVQRQTMVTLAGAASHLPGELVARAVSAISALEQSPEPLVRDEAADTLMVIREKVASKMAA